MSFAKWLSVGIGVTCALLIGALAWYISESAPLLLENLYVRIAVVLGLSGLAVAIAHRAVANSYDAELRQLATYIDALGRTGGPPPKHDPKMGLTTLAEAVDRTVGKLRTRIDQLTSLRRELEVQARVSDSERQHAEDIINSISDAVIVTDAFNELVLANQTAADILAFDLNQALRRPVDKVIRDPKLIKMVKDARQFGVGGGPRHVEHTVTTDDRHATYDVSLACLANDNVLHNGASDAKGVVAVLRDVTHEREVAEMKSQFVSNVSHELRTPLSSITAYVEMLIDGDADDEQTRTEFYNVIQGETNRLSRLIDNMLDISRIESGVVMTQGEHVEVDRLVHEAIEMMRPQARAKQIELIEPKAPGTPHIQADKDMIYQAVLNVLSNAVKYTKPGGTVTVDVAVDELQREVVVSVTDTGVGISEADIPHLFDKFYRVTEHKTLAEGTGLGLNLVKNIVETAHSGRIGVDSKVGIGSTFRISLPLAGRDQHPFSDGHGTKDKTDETG